MGDGTPRDVAEGARLYSAAAGVGHPLAMFNWGVMLRDGVGVEADQKEGWRWIQRAAEAGLNEARRLFESAK
jgi:TPR repeat protein